MDGGATSEHSQLKLTRDRWTRRRGEVQETTGRGDTLRQAQGRRGYGEILELATERKGVDRERGSVGAWERGSGMGKRSFEGESGREGEGAKRTFKSIP